MITKRLSLLVLAVVFALIVGSCATAKLSDLPETEFSKVIQSEKSTEDLYRGFLSWARMYFPDLKTALKSSDKEKASLSIAYTTPVYIQSRKHANLGYSLDVSIAGGSVLIRATVTSVNTINGLEAIKKDETGAFLSDAFIEFFEQLCSDVSSYLETLGKEEVGESETTDA